MLAGTPRMRTLACARGDPSRRKRSRDPGLTPKSLETSSDLTSGVAGWATAAKGRAENVMAAGVKRKSAAT
jgi:hypothetical protein